MSKAVLFCFYGDTKIDTEEISHNKLIDKSEMFKYAEIAYSQGFHLMIKPLKEMNEDGATDIIFYSKSGFAQR